MRSETETLKSERDYANAEQRSRVLDIVVREVKKFGTLFLYLALVFGLFTLHQWVVLASNHISYVFYGASVINALILAKIMLVAEALHFGERFRDKPLAYPILYKSVAFGLMLVIAYIAEEVIVGLLKGESLAQSAPELGGGTPAGIAAIALIMCVALIPFFAFKELRRVYGGAEFDSLVFKGRGAPSAKKPA
ncbi:MAG TPA: hypothetical protein VIM74_00870 [Casimicrobiaceae bacterium]